MGEIYLTEREIEAIKDVDERELSRLIDEAIRAGSLGDLYQLRLRECGPYVASKLHYFEKALSSYRAAKSGKKIEETYSYALRTGSDVRFAFSQMRRRMETEEQQQLYWRVDDNVFWPRPFTNDLSVTISYRWRKAVEDEWDFNSITFRHRFVPKPAYLQPQLKRKPSKAKQEENLQNELQSAWECLMKDALYALRDYFQDGVDGSKIPKIFQVLPDPRTGGLNNFSARFWLHDAATSG